MIDLPPGPNGLFRLVDHRFEFQSEPMLLSVPWGWCRWADFGNEFGKSRAHRGRDRTTRGRSVSLLSGDPISRLVQGIKGAVRQPTCAG